MSFRDNLKEAIEFKGIKYQELSKKTKIPLKTLENYTKKDASSPPVENAVKIARILGVSVEYLVEGNENKKSDETIILFKNKDLLNNLSKLDKNHLDAITAMAKTLLQLQGKKK